MSDAGTPLPKVWQPYMDMLKQRIRELEADNSNLAQDCKVMLTRIAELEDDTTRLRERVAALAAWAKQKEAARDVHKRHHEKLSTQVIHLKHTMDEMKEARDKRIAELEQENKALRRTVPHKLWEKHNDLLKQLEQLQRWNQVTQSYVVEPADDGLWVKWFDLYGVIKRARDE